MGLLSVQHIIAVDATGPADDVDPPEGAEVRALCGKTVIWGGTRRHYLACLTCTEVHLAESDQWRQAANREADLAQALAEMEVALAETTADLRDSEDRGQRLQDQVARASERLGYVETALTRQQQMSVGHVSRHTLGHAVGEIYHLRAALAAMAHLLEDCLALKTFPRSQREPAERAREFATGLARGRYAGDRGYQRAIADGHDLDLKSVLAGVGADGCLTNEQWMDQAGLVEPGVSAPPETDQHHTFQPVQPEPEPVNA